METKLDPEFKAKWVAALRSGEYKQGVKNLYNSNNNTYCCLGVACVILGMPKEKINKAGMIYKSGSDYLSKEALDLGYPESLAARPDVNAHQPGNWDGRVLAEMNDRSKSFNEIADYIEQNL